MTTAQPAAAIRSSALAFPIRPDRRIRKTSGRGPAFRRSCTGRRISSVARARGPLACLALLFLAACAKTGDPQPPVPIVPKPAQDLSAAQTGAEIVLSVTHPAENTDGSRVERRGKVELLRREEPAGSAPAPVPQIEFTEGASVVLTVPPELIGDFERDGKLVMREPADAARRAGGAVRYAVRFHNRKGRSAGISNQVVIVPVSMPAPPAGLRAEVIPDGVRLSWRVPESNADGTRPPRIAGYNVYRTEEPGKAPFARLTGTPSAAPAFEDTSAVFGRTYLYAVSVVARGEAPTAESPSSAPVRVQPKDTFPPGRPANVQAVAAGEAILLLWTAPPERDVAGYRIARLADGGAAEPLFPGLVTAFSYRDEKTAHGRKYEYRISAVDQAGNEGPAASVSIDFP